MTPIATPSAGASAALRGPTPGSHGDPGALRRAARDFEAQAFGALLQPMFEGLSTSGSFGGGAAEAQWRPMLVDAMAKQATSGGSAGLGIADAMLRQLLQAQASAGVAAGSDAAMPSIDLGGTTP